MNFSELLMLFSEQFGPGKQPVRTFFAPGRVNLLGEHTDYNGGLVFPCAINFGTALLIRKRRDRLVKLSSRNFGLVAFLSSHELMEKYGDHWINYPLGVIDQFRKRGVTIEGFEFMYSGDIPNGAGLSSSASLEVVTAFALNELLQLNIEKDELVRLSQAAENDFVGVNCGIMDQYASAMGEKGHAMKLDCVTLDCEQVPMELDSHSFVIVNSNQRRELTESGYNERFAESQKALTILRSRFGVNALAAVTQAQLESARDVLGELLFRRAKHVISENQRVIDAAIYLKQKDFSRFGKLMNESHDSMRDDYEISTDIINTLVEIAQSQAGVLGARITGAGFGGCIVALLEKDKVEEFTQSVSRQYQDATGLSADIYPVNLEDGVREILA